MPENRSQHYVPIVYLKGFSLGFPQNYHLPLGNISLYIYDKTKMLVERKGVKNILKSNYYYTIYRNDGSPDNSLEVKLSHYEKGFRNISRILFEEHIVNGYFDCELFEDPDARKAMAYYMLLQLKRVPKFREKTEKDFRESGLFKTETELNTWLNYAMVDFGEGNYGYPSLRDIFIQKNWSLLCIRDEIMRYISSDAPVCFFNGKPLMDPESEIWFPINEKILLQLYGKNNQTRVVFMDSGKADHRDKIHEINDKISLQAHRVVYSSDDRLLTTITKRNDYNVEYKYI